MTKSCWRSSSLILRQLLAVSACLLLTYQPVAWSATPVAVGQISTNGAAEINGVDAVTGGTVFSGDRIITPRGATASLSLAGGSQLILVGSSSVQVNNAGSQLSAALEHGKLAILSPARAPVVVEAGGIRIVPRKDGSLYAVELTGNSLNVTARRGIVDVEAANRTIALKEGKTLRATLGPPQEPEGAGADGAARSRILEATIVASVLLAGTALALAIVSLKAGCKVSPSNVGTCQVTH